VHAQVYPPNKSVQVPPFWQGAEAQSFTSTAHVAPSQPAGQAQLKPFTRSVQLAPFWQGFGLQSFTFTSQVDPE
jgi:hypothetical protein